MSKALTAKENTKQKIAYNFTDLIPDYTFTVTGNQIGIRIHTILGADGYEVFRSKTARGKYELIVSSPSPVIEYYTADKTAYYYKVRAFNGEGEDRIESRFSKAKIVDLISSSKKRSETIEQFFEALKKVGGVLSYEDIDIAIESLKVASLEVKEKEKRRREEEKAEKVMEAETR